MLRQLQLAPAHDLAIEGAAAKRRARGGRRAEVPRLRCPRSPAPGPGKSRPKSHRAVPVPDGVCTSRLGARAGTGATSPQCRQVRCSAVVVTLEHRRELRLDVREFEELLVQLRVAALAVPLQAILLARLRRPFDRPARRCWPGAAGNAAVARAAGRSRLRGSACRRSRPSCTVLQHHVALELVEELLARIDMEIAARIGPADHHHDEVANRKHQLVARPAGFSRWRCDSIHCLRSKGWSIGALRVHAGGVPDIVE